MRKTLAACALAMLAACGSSTEPVQQQQKKAAVDPAISIHLVNRLDTTTTIGRAHWNTFALIYSPADPGKAGVALLTGGPSPLGRPGADACLSFQADSIGARYVIILGLADTLHASFSQDPQGVANAWYGGNHALPSGWAALATDSLDWGVSQQFTAGHGQTVADPVRWDLTWTSPATVTRAEAATDAVCGTPA